MSIQVNIGGAWKASASFSVNVGGAWKAVDKAWVRVGGAWKQYYGAVVAPPAPSLDATMQVASVSGSRTGTGPVTTSAAKVLPTGGTAPYTYLWSRVSGAVFNINTPTAQQTTFTTATDIPNGESVSGVYKVLVTDSTPGTPKTIEKTVNVNATSVFTTAESAFSVIISPGSGYAERTGDGVVESAGFYAQPEQGNIPGMSYYWFGNNINVRTPYNQYTSVYATLAKGTEVVSTLYCRVTDSGGRQGLGVASIRLRAV